MKWEIYELKLSKDKDMVSITKTKMVGSNELIVKWLKAIKKHYQNLIANSFKTRN